MGYPYGCRDAGIDEKDLKKVFQKNLVILLGEQDINTNDKSLWKTSEANRQGPHRLARGKNYFQNARQNGRKMGATFRWFLQTVPRVGHSNSGMARVAAPLLLDPKKRPR